MIGEILAIITAILRGYAVVPLRKGLKFSTPSTSSLVYLTNNTVMLWTLTLYNHPLELLTAYGAISYFPAWLNSTIFP